MNEEILLFELWATRGFNNQERARKGMEEDFFNSFYVPGIWSRINQDLGRKKERDQLLRGQPCDVELDFLKIRIKLFSGLAIMSRHLLNKHQQFCALMKATDSLVDKSLVFI